MKYFDCHGYWGRKIRGTTVYQHREIMEAYLGRKLGSNEVVHHINGKTKDNRIENLELLSSSTHSKKHAKKSEIINVTCIHCGKPFTKRAKDERARRKKSRFGPFCGNSCKGVWGRRTQINNGINLGTRSSIDISDVIKDMTLGRSLRAIAKKWGVDHSTIRYQLNKFTRVQTT